MSLLLVAAISALVNLVILAGIPFLCYFIYHKWRHRRAFLEITQRAGLRIGGLRYLVYCVVFAIAAVIVLVVWPPAVEPYTRDGSPQQVFVGLGPSGQAILMALLYGVVKTGFPEELLFRGLITGSLSRRMPHVWANVLQAAIFLLPHFIVLFVMPEFWTALPLVFVGALFVGWIRIKSGSILGPWLIHAALNVTVCLSVAMRSAG